MAFVPQRSRQNQMGELAKDMPELKKVKQMRDFPDWLREALQTWFDEQSSRPLKHLPIKNLRERTNAASEQFQQKVSEANEEDFLQWEEACNYLHGKELEWLYMQGVKDGAQILFSLLICQDLESARSATMATCGKEGLNG